MIVGQTSLSIRKNYIGENLKTFGLGESVELNFEISCGKIVKIVYNGPIFFPPTGKSPKPAAAPQSYQPSRVKM